MKQSNYILTFILLVILQVLICNYLNLTHYVLLSILPVLILCSPIKFDCITTMCFAFIAGLCVDFFAEGIIGLNALALVPVAYLRKPIISLVFGREVFARKENISLRQHGALKMSTAIVLAQSLFLLVYLWADGAWARQFVFNITRFICSLGAGYVLSIFLVSAISEEKTNRWK